MNPETKKKLYKACVEQVEERIDLLKKSIQEATEIANEETKSSAGDKYETTRAMMHLEIEKNTQQLSLALKNQKVLKEINPSKPYDHIDLGALVQTDKAMYFLTVGMGQIIIDDSEYLIISPVSPVGQLMMGLSAGDSFEFRGTKTSIEKVL